jgi:DNA-binding IclR family transcriptional regulator
MDPTVASAADVNLLQAYAEPDRLRILELLYERPSSQKEMAAALEINPGTVSRHMATLRAAGLVYRVRNHGPYELLAPNETWQVLRATTNLGLALARARLQASEERGRAIQRLAMRPADEEERPSAPAGTGEAGG